MKYTLIVIYMSQPKYSDVDVPEEFDATAAFKESRFSTFQHMNNSDCPANNDISKKNLH